MKKLLAPILITLSLVVAILGVTHSYSDYASKQITEEKQAVQLQDFAQLKGNDWKGTLSYLDYSSKKRTSIPVKAQFELKGKNIIRYGIQYPGEAHMNSYEKIKISRRGDKLNKRSIINVIKNKDGLIVTTLHKGKDDSQPAEIRTTYSLSTDSFVIAKDVKFKNSKGFFNRSKYTFKRGVM